MELKEFQICITSICKIGCTYCHLNKIGDSMSIETFKKAIQEAKKYNVEYIRLTGGNVFEHENLVEFLKIIKQNNLKSIVNISILSIKDFPSIIDYTDILLFSFHNTKQLDLFNPRLLEFKKQKKDLILMGCIVFESEWLKQLKPLSEKIDIFDNFFFLRDTNKSDKQYFNDLNQCVERCYQLNKKITFANGFPLCHISRKSLKQCAGAQFDNGNIKLYLKPDGTIKPSAYSALELGNINENNNLEQIWEENQKNIYKVFKKLETCQKCKIKNYCKCGILTIKDYQIDPLFQNSYYNSYPTDFQKKLRQELFKIKDKNKLKIEYHENSSFFMRYPPTIYWKPIEKKQLLTHFKLKDEKLNIYIHFPFCSVSCKFCNVKKFSVLRKENHIKELLEEIELHKDLIKNNKINSIYFGGGSPQLMGADGAKAIFEKLFSLFQNKPVEVNFELFPKNFDKELMTYLKKYVTRISIGIQCFNQKNLQRLNRIVTKQEMIEFIKKVKELNFENLNFDIIFGLFINEPELFEEDIKDILSYKPTHVTYQPLHFTKEMQYDENNNLINAIKLNTKGREILKQEGFTQNSAEDFSIGEKLKYQGAMLNQENLLGIGENTFGLINGVCYRNQENKYDYHILTKQDRLFGKLFLSSRFLKLDIKKLDEKYKIDYKASFSDSIKYLLAINFIEIKNNILTITKEGEDYVDLISNILSLSNLDYKLIE